MPEIFSAFFLILNELFLRKYRYSLCKGDETMEDISKLLKEAKPMYFARKRRNNRIKAVVCMLVCVWGLSTFYPQKYNYDWNAYSGYDLISSEVSMTETGSVIEEMGLPTDEYGLLMVG